MMLPEIPPDSSGYSGTGYSLTTANANRKTIRPQRQNGYPRELIPQLPDSL